MEKSTKFNKQLRQKFQPHNLLFIDYTAQHIGREIERISLAPLVFWRAPY
jgi:hypothetical protein